MCYTSTYDYIYTYMCIHKDVTQEAKRLGASNAAAQDGHVTLRISGTSTMQLASSEGGLTTFRIYADIQ